MEDILMQLIQSQGIWAVLFVFLLLYTIKKNDKLDEIQDSREKKYQEVISELTDQLSIVNIINKKLDSICSSQTKNSE
ncbi:MAG: BhlA/UviB family holin-like peptide [Alitiscatomonas sp.]